MTKKQAHLAALGDPLARRFAAPVRVRAVDALTTEQAAHAQGLRDGHTGRFEPHGFDLPAYARGYDDGARERAQTGYRERRLYAAAVSHEQETTAETLRRFGMVAR